MNSEKRVLIVEDEAKIAAVLRDYLISDGCVVDIISKVASVAGMRITLDTRLTHRHPWENRQTARCDRR